MTAQRSIRLPVLQMERVEQLELLDQGRGSAQEVRRNLAEMQRINDLLGGTRALTRHLYPRLLGASRAPAHLLDLGTGAAGMLPGILRWAQRRGLVVSMLAVDWSARNLRAMDGEAALPDAIRRVQANALALPLAPGSVDWVISSLFLHHLRPAEVVRVLRDSFRVARRGVVMSDLVRGYLPLAAFQLVSPIFARTYLTRSDGALSIRRAYTPRELHALALQAGLPAARLAVHSHFPWRMTLTVDHER